MAATITLQQYERAERELEREEVMRGFQFHRNAYLIVNALLLVINLLVRRYTDANFLWFVFPLICWGVGLTMHYAMGVRRFEANITQQQARIEQRAQGI